MPARALTFVQTDRKLHGTAAATHSHLGTREVAGGQLSGRSDTSVSIRGQSTPRSPRGGNTTDKGSIRNLRTD